MSQNLTELSIQKKHRPKDQRYEVPDRAQRGLYLVIQPSGKGLSPFVIVSMVNSEN